MSERMESGFDCAVCGKPVQVVGDYARGDRSIAKIRDDGRVVCNYCVPIGRAVEHSIEDPFTGEITVRVVLD